MRNWNKSNRKINYIWKVGRYIWPRPGYQLMEFKVLREIINNLTWEVESLEIEEYWRIKPDKKEIVIKNLNLNILKFN